MGQPQPWPEDLTFRRQAWDALSSLFLDTDISLLRAWRAKTLAPLPYSFEALDQILLYEVRPACEINLWVVAGEWAGFDLQWLEERIRKRQASRLRKLRNLLRWPLDRHIKAEWEATKHAMAALQDSAKQSDQTPCA